MKMTLFKISIKLSILSFFFVFTGARYGFSQDSTQDFNYSILSLGMDYGANLPKADLGDRFGFISSVGAHLEYNTKNNWLYRINSSFYFGSNVKEDVLSNLRTSDGVIIGNNKAFAHVFMRSRMLSVSGSVGKLFPFKESLPKTGLFFNAGVGFLGHKVRVQDDSQSLGWSQQS